MSIKKQRAKDGDFAAQPHGPQLVRHLLFK
jgi:hypothetical protein